MEKELSDALIDSKGYHPLSTKDARSISASRSSKSSNRLRNCKKYCDRELLKKEILEAQIPMSLSRHIFNYFDECLSYAHSYIFEVCNDSWHKYTAPHDWVPNEFVAICEFGQGRRGRCYRKPGFVDLQQYCEDQLQNIGAPILQYSEIVTGDGTVFFDVSSAFFQFVQ